METIDSMDDYKSRLAAAVAAQQQQDQDQAQMGSGPQIGGPDQPPPPPQPQGQGPDVGNDPALGDPQAPQTIDGQGPSIDPAGAPPEDDTQMAPANGPPPAAQPASMPSVMFQNGGGGGGGSTIDGAPPLYQRDSGIAGMGGLAPDAPSAPDAPNAPNAPTIRNAPTAPNAPNAPVLRKGSAKQATARAAGQQLDGSSTAGPAGAIDEGGAANLSPAAAHRNGETLPDGRPGINVHPDTFDPTDADSYKPGALKALETSTTGPAKPSHAFDALTDQNQDKYMDWWEKQHGEISDRYAQLQQQLGARPDPNRDPTQKEKFQELMDFGISLLARSGRSSPYEMENTGAAFGGAMADARDRQLGRQSASTADYDRRQAMLIAAKKEDDRDLGNYGQAVRESALIENAKTRTEYYKDQANKAGKPSANTFRVDDKGNLRRWDPSANNGAGGMVATLDEKGNPVKEPIGTGTKGGRPGLGSAVIQQMRYLQQPASEGGMGMSAQDAFNAVYHVKPSGNIQHDFVSILNKNTPQNATPEEREEARQAAKEGVESVYGVGSLDRAKANAARTPVPTAAPPPGSLKEGAITTFGNGQKWTMRNGQPARVQ